MALTPFDLAGYFVDDARALVAARTRAGKVHRNRDIDAAGDEVEIPVREVLSARLSRRYYVGHGHIVDARLMTSRQLDVVIADDANTPVLFRARNGTEFLPYESVYAVGDGRSTYYKANKPIEAFSGVIEEITTGLVRQRITFAMGSNGVTNVVRQNPQGLNPLFAFMLFVGGNDFDFADVREFYHRTPVGFLPNAVCLLDRGVILPAAFARQGNFHVMRGVIISPLTTGPGGPDEAMEWVFVRATDPDGDKNMGFALALLCFMLFGSLSGSAVLPPDMGNYLGHVLHSFPSEIVR